jgi:nucleotide-binding universal stress UspA family protein
VAQASEALTIVIGYDGSDAARRGLFRVGHLVAAATKLVVVTVTPEAGSPSTSPEPLIGHDFDAERLLAEAVELIGCPDGTTIERRAAAGDPAQVLVEVAREVGAHLLIVGRRGSDFVARVLLGSVAQRVTRDAGCDVLVVA